MFGSRRIPLQPHMRKLRPGCPWQSSDPQRCTSMSLTGPKMGSSLGGASMPMICCETGEQPCEAPTSALAKAATNASATALTAHLRRAAPP